MIRLTAYVHAPHLDAAEVDALAAELRTPLDEIDALTCTIEPTRGLGRGAGELMLLAAFADAVAFERARSHPAVVAALGPMLRAADARWEGVRYAQGPVVLRRPDLVDGVQRTLLLRVRPTASPNRWSSSSASSRPCRSTSTPSATRHSAGSTRCSATPPRRGRTCGSRSSTISTA